MDGEETLPLLSARNRRGRALSVAALAASIALVAGQIVFQMAVPRLTERLSDRLALSIAVGVPAVAEHLGELVWIPITNDLDRLFHWRLIWVRLDSKQRDALRKCDSLDAVLRICVLRLPAILFSTVQAYHQAVGVNLAILVALLLVGLNAAGRAMAGQGKAIEDNWEKSLRRNETL